VETFETGEHITKYVEMGPGAPHNADLAELGSGAMLQMMLVDNLIHSDLHPGMGTCNPGTGLCCVASDAAPSCNGLSWRSCPLSVAGGHAAGNIMVHLDPPRGTRALYERFADFIGLKVILLGSAWQFTS
jgi:hypothetical protein